MGSKKNAMSRVQLKKSITSRLVRVTYICGENNGGDSLNGMREECREVEMKMSTAGSCFGEQGCHFGDVPSQPTGCFGEVQVYQNNGGDSLKSKRDESGEVEMKLSSKASQKRKSDFVEENRRQQIHQISASKNNKHHDDLKTPISFIHP